MSDSFDITTAIQRYLDGSISSRDLARLDEALRASQSAADAFARATRLDDGLRAHYEARESRRMATGELRNVARRVRARRPLRIRVAPVAAMAAAAVVVVAVGIAFLSGGDTTAIVASTTGQVDARRDGGTRPLDAGDAVRPGTTVAVADGGAAVLRYEDGTELTLGERTRLELLPGDAKRLRLGAGCVEAEVAPQPRGRAMTFSSDHVTVTVIGTRLALGAGGESTEVWVTRGAARVARASDGRTADLKSGQGTVVARDDADDIVVRSATELAAGLHRGLTVYWPMDEGEGETVTCAAGSGIEGRLPGARWVNGIRGTALHFDGYEFFESRTEVELGANATLACWFRMEAEGALVCNNGLHATPYHASTKDMLFLGIERGRIKGCTDISSKWPDFAVYGRRELRTEYWHHAVFVMRDGVHLTLYLDGELESTRTIERNAPFSGHVIVGWSGASWTHMCFRGDVDEVRVYDRALSEHEAKTLYDVR